MKPAPFDYHRPESLDDALSLLAAHEGAKPLAGGQSLIPAMNFRLATPSVLIDLNRIPELAYISETNSGLKIGGMTRHRAVEHSELVMRRAPLLHETMPYIAHAAIRTRGTLGGSLAHADPAAELPAVVVALDATIGVRGPAGARRIAAADFFTGLFSTALEPGELVVDVEIPGVPRRSPEGAKAGWAFAEVSRRHGDFALAGVAVSLSLDDRGRCADARIVLLSVGDRPMLAVTAAKALVGETTSAEVVRAAAEAVLQDIDPTSDIHASAEYRRQLARVLTRRAVTTAFARCS